VKCQNCSENEATIHFKEVKNNEVRELHLCRVCAEEKGFHSVLEQDKQVLANQFIWMAENLHPESAAKMGQIQCGECGLRYSEFTQTARLGCEACYAAFEVQLRRLLRRIHGATSHAGKTPGVAEQQPSTRLMIQRLQDELQRAIAAEEFERAAELRDRIRGLELEAMREEPST
jgi:protein arginine kinase activator